MYPQTDQSDIVKDLIKVTVTLYNNLSGAKSTNEEVYVLTFEMIRVLRTMFMFVFITVIGLNTTFLDYDKACQLSNNETKKVKLLREIGLTQAKIYTVIEKLNKNKIDVFDPKAEEVLRKIGNDPS